MKMLGEHFAVGLALVVFCAIGTAQASAAEKAKITVESPKFKNGEAIPAQYTGDGKDVSPPINWSGLPATAKQLALICDDPKAPSPKPWVHWVIYKIPASAKGLPEAIPTDAELKAPAELAHAVQGLTGWKAPGYRGPAPPKGSGKHEYHFKVYALDKALDLKPGLDKMALLKEIEGHVVGEGEVVGLYERK